MEEVRLPTDDEVIAGAYTAEQVLAALREMDRQRERAEKAEQRIEDLEEALVVRIKYNVCPDCDALIADGFDHKENCRHYATEGGE